uniref:Lethal hybrid rescue protein n=1 Tax=Drosophila simulans TaxID=7240 RepID=A9XTY1_DROSI|nr:lethal hybrid rescue protein [Drosophila simulans]ABV55069.1 lethal hybrid rescue protein [Drosophila simulans]
MSTDSAEETAIHSTVPHLEINISNTNISGQIVLNDVLLMEMLARYPFLIIPQVEPKMDVEYNSWGWDQLTKSFNQSYESVELSTPFSVTELKLRWVKLRPLLKAFAAAKGQIPEPLFRVMNDVHIRMQSAKPADVPKTKCQEFLLSQLPFVKSLSPAERRHLEVEVLDLILEQERQEKATRQLGPIELKTVQSEYEEFLKAIRVKELPANTLLSPAIDGFRISPRNIRPNVASANKRISYNGVSNESNDVKIKTETAIEPKTEDATKFDDRPIETPRYVPLKSAKYYIKSCRIRLKRVEIDDYLPLARILRSRRPTLRT